MFQLSGFADEISADLNEQLDVLERLGIRFLEFRGVWNTGVLDLSDEQVRQVKAALDSRGIGISAIGSPIGKIRIDDPFEPHLKAFERAVMLAEYFQTPYIRLFSFFVPEGEAEAHRDEVMRRIEALLEASMGHPVTLLHENERHIYGDVPSRCLDLLKTFDTPRLRFTFDPANFVLCGVRPFTDGYELLRPYTEYLHIKDALREEGRVVPAGEGDGELAELVRALVNSDFDGFASLEPHLRMAGDFRGDSGPELFEVATTAFRKLMNELGATERRS
ncbi:MAG: sugar phosphate isomerase/epimerase family protein [Anaerolineae bacterium]|jgi:3-dehydroshikimate dehydratase|nr:sugar phosphate isomerase/epimerase [Chloroflexota bacterium]